MVTKFRQFVEDFKPDYSALLLSFTINLLLYFAVFRNIIQIPLRGFPDRSIGISVISGVDANLRTLYYCLTIFLLILLIFCLFVFFTWINARARKLISPVYIRAEQSIQFCLSLFSLFLTFYAIFNGELAIIDHIWTMIAFTAYFYFIIFLKISAFKRSPVIFGYYKDYSVTALSMILSVALFFAGWAYGVTGLVISAWSMVFFFLFNAVFIALYPLVLSRSGVDPMKVRSANLAATFPLVLIPVLLPLMNEVQYAISGVRNIDLLNYYRIVLGILVLAAVACYVLFLFRPASLRTSSVVRYYLFPGIIIGFFLFGAIDGILKFQNFDLFHNGERMLITHQLFAFGRIPFIDIIPTHGIMDFFGQSIYTAVNGLRGPEMFLWRWIPVLAGILLLYFILAKLTSPVFSFLLVFIAPEAFIVHNNYRICIAIALVLLWVIRRPDMRRYLILWISVVLLFFWRYDFGVMAAISSLCIIPGIFYNKTGEELSVNTLFKGFKTPLFAMGIVFFTTLVIYSLVLILNGQNPLLWLEQFYYYFKVQVPTQSTAEVFTGFSLLFMLEYIVTPAISIFYILYYLYSLVFRKTQFKAGQIILLWLAIFALILSMRMVQRHTIIEGFNPVYSIFLLCSASVYIARLSKQGSQTIFLLTFLLYAMILAGEKDKVFVKTNTASLVPGEQLYDSFLLQNKASRVLISDSSQFKKYRIFCDAYLKKDQTFFDFTNAPLLYLFTNRLFPAHLIPNLYQAADPIEDFVIKRLDRYREAGKMPLVLFKQNTVWDSVDGVPQPLRSYRVAEFIYSNYMPFAKVDNYEIWKDIKTDLSMEKPEVMFVGFREKPGTFSSDVDIKQFTGDSILMRTYGRDPIISGMLDLGSGILMDPAKTFKVKLIFTCNQPGTLQVFYSVNGSMFNEKMSGSIQVKGEKRSQEYTLILPGFKNGSRLTNLRLDPPAGAEFCLYRPQIVQSEYFPVDRTDPQHFNFRKLPYIWANFDAKNASSGTKILQDHNVTDSILGAGETRIITIGKDLDKRNGNYIHLYMRTKEKGVVFISYGADPSSVQFDTEPTGKVEQYLVRISTQWAWMNDQVDKINIRASVPVVVSRMVIREGD